MSDEDKFESFNVNLVVFNPKDHLDTYQPGSRRLTPAFPETSLKKQEAYIERMILRDKELGWT